MLLVLAALLSAPTAAVPFLEMSAGPLLLHKSGHAGLDSGPLVRLDAGLPLSERFAAELWAAGSMQAAPLGSQRGSGDQALVGGGIGGRLLVHQFDAEGRLGLWARGGLGYLAATSGEGAYGPTGFGGAALVFQPWVKRFAIGVEADAVGTRSALGLLILPTLRCSL